MCSTTNCRHFCSPPLIFSYLPITFQGMYSEAEPLYERPLAVREKVLGPEHPDVATTLDNRVVLLSFCPSAIFVRLPHSFLTFTPRRRANLSKPVRCMNTPSLSSRKPEGLITLTSPGRSTIWRGCCMSRRESNVVYGNLVRVGVFWCLLFVFGGSLPRLWAVSIRRFGLERLFVAARLNSRLACAELSLIFCRFSMNVKGRVS